MFSLKIKYAIQILSELRCYNERGVCPNVSNLRERCGFQRGGDQLRVMAQLRNGGWVSYDGRYYRLSVDLTQKTLYDLMVTMNEEIRIGPSPAIDWPVKNRSLYDPAIILERELQTDFERKFKKYPIADLTGAATRE